MTRAEQLDWIWKIRRIQKLILAETGIFFTAREIVLIHEFPVEVITLCA